MNLSGADIFLIIVIVVAAIIAGLYFLNRWAYKKMDAQQSMIDSQKMTQTIFVIDKKRDKVTNVNLPKAIITQMPKTAKLMKMYFVQAKIGPQIMTFMCDKNVFNAIPLRKNVKVELAGIYIINVVGMKTKEELKKIAKEKKAKEKAEKKADKK